MPKLTIITINYNNLEGLKRTVESVVNQTWKEFEYVVIDGGSTDGSAAYIESQSDKIDYWVSESDGGIYNAMNKGIAKATGEYLLFLNSGDHLNDATVLEKKHHYLKEKDFIYFNINVVAEHGTFIKKGPKEISFSHFVDQTLMHQATFIRGSLFETIGLYDEKLKIVSDWKFFIIAFSKYNASYCYINDVFSTHYRDGISCHIENEQLIADERESVLSSEFKIFKDEAREYLKLKKIIYNLQKSKKIKWLIKLKLLNKF